MTAFSIDIFNTLIILNIYYFLTVGLANGYTVTIED